MRMFPATTDDGRFAEAVNACLINGPSRTIHAYGAKWVITARVTVWHAIALEPHARLPDLWWQSPSFLASDDWLVTFRSGSPDRLIDRVRAEGACEVRDIRAERLLQAEFADMPWWVGRILVTARPQWTAWPRSSAAGSDRLVARTAGELGARLRLIRAGAPDGPGTIRRTAA